jgi:hypothetical protein
VFDFLLGAGKRSSNAANALSAHLVAVSLSLHVTALAVSDHASIQHSLRISSCRSSGVKEAGVNSCLLVMIILFALITR